MSKNILKPVIYAGLFAIPFIPFLVSSSLFFPFITTKAFAFRIIVEIILAAWIVLAVAEPEYRPKKSVILYSLAGFLAVIALADVLGVAPVKSFWSNYERMEGLVTLLHLGAFFIVIGSVFKEIDWSRWWNTSLGASALMVAYCLFQLLGVFRINQGGVRVDGTFGNASYLAVYMLIHIFIAILFLWRGRKNAVSKWMYSILILGQVYILYATATRGAILGLLGGLLVFALLNLRNKEDKGIRKASIAMVVGLALVVGGFMLARESAFVQNNPVLKRFAEISTTELTQGGRAFVWPMAIEGVKERPILGWGQDNFNYVFNKNYDARMFRLEPWFDRAHNIFLDWAVAGGLLGLLAYLSLYVSLLYLIWKQSGIPLVEKSILTGLIAAYFFHNLFVFDHLISYVLFFSLLAYVHSKSEGRGMFAETALAAHGQKGDSRQVPFQLTGAIVVLALAFTLYYINFRPMGANASLINALQHMQTGQHAQAMEAFRKAHDKSRLGRPEVVEQLVTNSVNILDSNLPMGLRNEFFHYSRTAIKNQADLVEGDARYQVMAGSFLWRTGQFEEAEAYLNRAVALMPEKQFMYFERGTMHLNRGHTEKALADFKTAYELAPEYEQARRAYEEVQKLLQK